MFGTLISISGPTSVGKTSVSIYLAKKLKTEILSCDSRQFYKELKIGTGTPNENQLRQVNHHFIGHVSIFQNYNIANFEIDALKKINNLLRKYKIIIMVGGSGLYENSVIQGLDTLPTVPNYIREELKNKLNQQGIIPLQEELQYFDSKYYNNIDNYNTHKLIRALEVIRYSKNKISSYCKNKFIPRTFRIIQIGLILDRKEIYIRIINKVNSMLNNGLIEEAKKLYKYKYLNALNTLGYKELFKYISGVHKLEKTIEEIRINTKKYAKRQLTWYRNRPNIIWFNPKKKDKILWFIKKKLGL
jgi:tRNA dimethylallyltransferase